MELIDLIIRLLMGLFFMFFGISSSVTEPSQAPEPTVVFSNPQGAIIRSYTNIYSVDLLVLESFPMQVQLQVSGEHPDGCQLPVVVEQRRDGDRITVEIYRELPAEVMCPMMLQPYADSIMLEGNFMPGDYVFKVNDYVIEQTL